MLFRSLTVRLFDGHGEATDSYALEVGIRTIEVQGDRLLLNGTIQLLQQPERVVGFFNTYRDQYPVTRAVLRGANLSGASAARARLIGAYVLEYSMLGLATALFGVAAGSAAAWMVLTEVMNLPYVWQPGPAAAAAFSALIVTLAFGLLGTFTALGHKPATVLRNL